MTAIRRYIEPPKWWSQDHMVETVPTFIRAVEQLCLDAGLVKSSTADNMDTSNITLPTFPMTGAVGSWNNTCSKTLSFDLNDSMQTSLPIRIEFAFGYYCQNTNTKTSDNYYPYFNYTNVRVGVIDKSTNKLVNAQSFVSASKTSYTSQNTSVFYKTIDDYRPFTEFGGMDSFINVSDGFVAMSILPEFSESTTATTRYSTEIFFMLERSFDDLNIPTPDNINLICVNSAISFNTTTSRLYTYVIARDTPIFSTLDTMNYYTTPHDYNKGNLILFPFMHFNVNYSIQQSPNFCGINTNVLSVGVETMVSINDMPAVNFIKTSVRDSTNYPTASTNCGLLFRFE